ncbi:hypothetical protein SVIO_025370 [Streptomyces violaceusniger]|uniref:Uncharacterized protein n=1 Tax=Streptomyces violaceusniger TaxID=68280 RepID=A0A4D4KUS3_STRVO|nr:hypothetical protein SVIO_025370 [Streptomyces violaceusniger]
MLCIGARATALGGYDTLAGPLSVARGAARHITEGMFATGADL